MIDRPLERVLTLGFDRGCSKAQFLECIVQCLPTDTAPNVFLGSASPGELSSTLIGTASRAFAVVSMWARPLFRDMPVIAFVEIRS